MLFLPRHKDSFLLALEIKKDQAAGRSPRIAKNIKQIPCKTK